jgi:4-aminobutyrate aminotransferase-like enzyme
MSHMPDTFIGPEKIIDEKSKHLIPCVYHFYKNPPQLVRGEMQYLYDHMGRKYLDFYAGVSVVNAGHCNPDITEVTCAQIKTLQHTTTIYLTQPIVELARRIAELAPGSLSKSFFCNSGSEANEGALLLAKLSTGKSSFISLQSSLHGRTYLTMSLTGLPLWRTEERLSPDVSFIPSPYCYRCPYGAAYPSCDLTCAAALESMLRADGGSGTAAFIAEPVAGNGGIIVPPPGYFARIREITKNHGVLFVCDEIQTGFGRTGKTFAIEHWNTAPDIMTVAKALANGLPTGAFIATPDIADAYTKPGASTFGGNPVTAATALATLDFHRKHKLADRAAALGAYFMARLHELQDKHPLIGDVRGKGLMIGAELVGENREPAAAAQTDWILEFLKDRGLFIGKTGAGRNVLAFQPPLIITQDNIDEAVSLLDEALQRIPEGLL